jgi:hypothetical protein
MNEDASNGLVSGFPNLPPKLSAEESEQLGDMIWAATDKHLQELYPDEFVAVYQRQVIAHGDDLAAVYNEAERITGRPRHKIAITTILGPGLLFAPR